AALADQEAAARGARDELSGKLASALEQAQALRASQLAVEAELEGARGTRERARAEQTALEALQRAALTHDAGSESEWLAGAGLSARPRVTETLEVQSGWERAVETALGEYLEAICVDGLDEHEEALSGLATGRIGLVETGGAPRRGGGETLAAKVSGPAAVVLQLVNILTAESLAEALRARASLSAGQSIFTSGGEWVGRGCLRISRNADSHTK